MNVFDLRKAQLAGKHLAGPPQPLGRLRVRFTLGERLPDDGKGLRIGLGKDIAEPIEHVGIDQVALIGRCKPQRPFAARGKPQRPHDLQPGAAIAVIFIPQAGGLAIQVPRLTEPSASQQQPSDGEQFFQFRSRPPSRRWRGTLRGTLGGGGPAQLPFNSRL